MGTKIQFNRPAHDGETRLTGEIVFTKIEAQRHFLLSAKGRAGLSKEAIQAIRKAKELHFRDRDDHSGTDETPPSHLTFVGAALDKEAFELISYDDSRSPYVMVKKTFPKAVVVDDIIDWYRIHYETFGASATILYLFQMGPDEAPLPEAPRLRESMPLPREKCSIILSIRQHERRSLHAYLMLINVDGIY